MKRTALLLLLLLLPASAAAGVVGLFGYSACNGTALVAGPNLVQSPDNLAGTGWAILNTTTAQGQGTAPDGTTNFNTVTDNSTADRHIAYQNGLNPNSAGSYTVSAYLKQGTLRYAQLLISDSNTGGASYGVVFDLQAGTSTSTTSLGTPTGTSSSIVATSQSGVWLASVTMNVLAGTGNVYAIIATSNSATPTYQANGSPTYAGSGQSIFVWDVSFTEQMAAGAACANPWQAAGYTINTFHAGSFSTSNVDTLLTKNAGFQFYLTGSFGFADTPAAVVSFNGDGSMTLNGNNAGGNGNAVYSLAAKATPVTAWHGQAFGGGAYFEAKLAFTGTGLAAWWADPMEHAAESSVFADNWQGQANGFVHFLETDFMEYFYGTGGNQLFQYEGTVIDWSGVFSGGTYPNQVQNSANRVITLPVGVDFTKPHRYGFLWVPATATASGYFQWYFDGAPTSDRVSYGQYNCAASPAPPQTTSSPWLYGVLDCQHPELVLNPSSTGTLTIYSVDVWQASSASNIVQ